MAGELVLITGTTGFLGYAVLRAALEAGYRVRAPIRDLSKAQAILSAPSIKALNPGSALDFVAVPDMLAPGAYDEVIKDVTLVIHVASPIPSAAKEGDDLHKVIVEPAIAGTMNVLKSASKVGTVKRVVVTSSVLAIANFAEVMAGTASKITESSRVEFVPPPYSDAGAAYGASKVGALNEAEAWVEKEKPSFDVVHICPTVIFGANELATTPEACFTSTNYLVLVPAAGKDADAFAGASIHLDDVATAHVKALDPKVPGNQAYITNSEEPEGSKFEQIMEIVARDYSDKVKEGVLSNNGKIVTLKAIVDSKKSQDVLGLKPKGFEQQVKSVIDHYLSLF
ncbi:hypothetical protein BDV95DRAFT_598328 [Massariosphaeria phaeospora]|uniref:NAD-dependent epimerase/dehydratase domain-containing protein n=1 Tax=Massariosphaeria phaeospora TaxID=100035 RepID=A0A7C8I7K4_9PLEO|nr:hypothetical protein BDV95DRAFT_598328 [Massariosphaeria phaeospora]